MAPSSPWRRSKTKGVPMDEVTARAVLVPASDVIDGVTASIHRSEIEAVLDAKELPIELVLDVKRLSDGESAEAHTVAVSWERSELERLLGEAQGDEVVLTFDRETLRRTIEDDVEAHGFREVALALAIAGTAATGAAATASAEPGAFLGSGTPIGQSRGAPRSRRRSSLPTIARFRGRLRLPLPRRHRACLRSTVPSRADPRSQLRPLGRRPIREP